MTPLDLSSLDSQPKLLFSVDLQPVQGRRFQPTGFPDLGAATFEAPDFDSKTNTWRTVSCLLVESAQSMANRLEAAAWDEATQDLKPELKGLSYVRVTNTDGSYFTSTVEEAHRINSVYVEKADGGAFHKRLKEEIGYDEKKPIDRRRFVSVLARYDTASLLHGVFLESIGGRLRVARALSGFIEAEEVRVAASGGVKNDIANPTGKTVGGGKAAEGYGNVPFSRDEYVAAKITAYFNLDLAQIRGYGLGAEATRMLTLLALYKIRAFLDGDLRLRTACDFRVDGDGSLAAVNLPGFTLPPLDVLAAALSGDHGAIAACRGQMAGVTVAKYVP